MKLVRFAGAGALAGAAGTVGLDAVQYTLYRRGGGKDGLGRWEFAGAVMSWDEASAPGQVARKVWRGVTGEEPPDEWARPATNLVHWATGLGWGLAYGVLAARTCRLPWLRALGLGPLAWLSGYVVLPLAKVYQPIWTYDARTLAKDLSGHVVYGSVASAAFRALTAKDSRRETP